MLQVGEREATYLDPAVQLEHVVDLLTRGQAELGRAEIVGIERTIRRDHRVGLDNVIPRMHDDDARLGQQYQFCDRRIHRGQRSMQCRSGVGIVPRHGYVEGARHGRGAGDGDLC